MNRVQKGNIAGIVAILLWATLALFTVFTNRIPPFELTFIAFSIAFSIGLFLWIKEGRGILVHLQLPWKVWFVGIYGLFGYHFFYFLALKSAPALEANLINYLWPLLIVLLSAWLPNEKLRWFHIVGALLGFFGALVLIGFGKEIAFSSQYTQGYMYALVCAFIWSSYSVLSRYFGSVPTLSVGGFCGASALFSLVAHLLFEQTYIPDLEELLAAIGLGLGPVGVAFFVWDYGMKQGDIKFIGSLSYATPLLSTLMLVLFGRSSPNSAIWLACSLIVLGSIISSLPFFKGLWQKISTHNRPL
ncbi:aromatic amino acid exporter YddG [Sulfurospirillum arsenophilum]|uniref:aromatic amino acid exporter YddG n=1 Tax=Sulfurospirillum arsenophilum TaxID=56698 RepID=UPI0005AB03E2|nr:EamA family transporter [Sulfurospirillum arsenophilum]